MTLPVEILKSVPPPGKAVWNANGGFVSVLLTHLFYLKFIHSMTVIFKPSPHDVNEVALRSGNDLLFVRPSVLLSVCLFVCLSIETHAQIAIF